jgi:hypothetical protein
MEGNIIMNDTQVEAKLKNLETQLKGTQEQIKILRADIESKVYTSELRRTEAILRNLISDCNSLITNLEDKLAKVILPAETRYYLDQGEVSQFQSNFNQLRAMMANFTQLYNNLVAYTSSQN